jgi:predicted metal-dependent peptidase
MCEALQRLSIARAQVARKLPYYHRIAYGLRPVEQAGLGTVGVTAEQVLLYDPQAVMGWREVDLPGVMLHEVLHLALRHPARIEALRAADGGAFDQYLANVACDFEVNRIVRALHLSLPEGAMFAEDYKLPQNVLAEEAYRLLKQNQEQDGQEQDGGKDAGNGGDNKGNGKGQAQDGGKGQEQDGGKDAGDGGDNKGNGKGQAQPKGKLAAGRCGSCAGNAVEGEDKVPDAAKASPLEQQAMQREVAQAIVDADKNNPGCVPGELLRDAQAMLQPASIPWQQVLARHVRRAVDRKRGTKDYTFARPNRRQATFAKVGDPMLPSAFDPIVDVAVVVDTSGSMGKRELAEALQEIDGILKATRTKLRVVSCDLKVQDAGKIQRAADAAKLLKGGGGTDFRPAFDYLQQHKPGVTVFVTDGYGPAPDAAPRWTDTVWLLVGRDTCKPWTRNGGPVAWGEFVSAKNT